ncbi:MAG: 3-deoxy-manno-octulosonate cytidylyltransferase [Bdellovibrionales bacterium]|nr:3-deoxy-manno-octulosonate cytidylyltransferase [Bdellovibrionales bacterium]
MSKKSVLILIPARFASSRFPGKPLAMIAGKTMISRVLTNCSKASHPDITFEAFVVTDSTEVEDHVKTFSSNVVRVDDDVISGTLRIELAYNRFFKVKNFDLIINVQGDEPLLEGDDLARLAEFHLNRPYDITTLVKKQMGFDQVFHDANKVKVAMSELTGAAFYFSRASIPFKRDSGIDIKGDYWFLHIGVYSYKPQALSTFAKGSVSRLEDLEKLEQLRALEIGMTIGALETNSTVLGVDHPEDVKKVEEVIYGRK